MKHFLKWLLTPSLSFCLAFTLFLGLKCRFTYQELDPRDCLSLCKRVSMCRLYVCVFPVAHTVRFGSACLLVLCVWLIVLASPRFPLASPSWTETKGQTSPCPRKEGLRETRQSGRRENRWGKNNRASWIWLLLLPAIVFMCAHQTFEDRNKQHEYECSGLGCRASGCTMRDCDCVKKDRNNRVKTSWPL